MELGWRAWEVDGWVKVDRASMEVWICLPGGGFFGVLFEGVD